jgi:hypothetical protein
MNIVKESLMTEVGQERYSLNMNWIWEFVCNRCSCQGLVNTTGHAYSVNERHIDKIQINLKWYIFCNLSLMLV